MSSCLEKQNQVITLFSSCLTQEEKYNKIIDLGKQLPKLEAKFKTPQNRVLGCQSITHLHSFQELGRIYFFAESEALISAGLAALLLMVYSGETAETILTCKPDYLDTLGIGASLTPSRANGLYSMHLRMKQDALKILTTGATSATMQKEVK